MFAVEEEKAHMGAAVSKLPELGLEFMTGVRDSGIGALHGDGQEVSQRETDGVLQLCMQAGIGEELIRSGEFVSTRFDAGGNGGLNILGKTRGLTVTVFRDAQDAT